MIFESHAHYDDSKFDDDREELLSSMQENGIEKIIRYFLGGDRPSQTARLTVSPDRIHGRRLETQQIKSGIPPATPHWLTPMLPSLPPILYMIYRIPVLSLSLIHISDAFSSQLV